MFFPYHLGLELQDNYEQLLTFIFMNNQELTFLLKTEADGKMLLHYVPLSSIDDTGTLHSDFSGETQLDISMSIEGTTSCRTRFILDKAKSFSTIANQLIEPECLKCYLQITHHKKSLCFSIIL